MSHGPHRIVCELSSLALVAGAVGGALPAIASLFGIVWYGLNIFDWIAAKVRRDRG